MDFLSFAADNIVIFDGAMGTSLQRMGDLNFGSDDYRGCNEALNLYSPDSIREVHVRYFEAGANVVETNTFGANSIVLAEYGLENEVEKINKAAVSLAKEASSGRGWVAGSIGPSTKMPTLGHISFDYMLEAYREQAKALIESGVDILLVETCQDILQTKIALIAIEELRSQNNPLIMVSLTLENNGQMLTGTDIPAALAILEPFKPDIIGLNCSAGPKDLAVHIGTLAKNFSGLVSFMPNAGTPILREGKTIYPETPEEFVDLVEALIVEHGIDIVGGCCGTTPEHIKVLANRISTKHKRTVIAKKQVSSLYSAVDLKQKPPPLLVGERANATGSKRFREMLLADNFEDIVSFAGDQVNEGAHIVDISVSYTGRNEIDDMKTFCELARTRLSLPIMIDSTNPKVIENALKVISGRSIINSVNLEDGGPKLETICTLARRFRVPVVALTIDEKGMAVDFDHKIEIFERLRSLLFEKYGLGDGDVFFDLLTFTVGSGEEKYRYAAKNTLEALDYIKRKYPDVLTILGVSNVSFGLAKSSRQYLNTVFLQHAVEKGLDAAIVHSGKIMPYHKIPEDISELCSKLLMGEDVLLDFMSRVEGYKEIVSEDVSTVDPKEIIRLKIFNGDKREIEEILEKLLKEETPLDVVNKHLISAMQEVGDLFRDGKMQLPFVLQAAEVMKACVSYLEPKMEGQNFACRGKLLLGTVSGDVHDIGKNLVKIILENNGYEVIDVGIKVPGNIFIQGINEHKPDAVGMSGLLVQSVQHMVENLQLMNAEDIKVPVLLGGAALTRRFVEDECQSVYEGPVVYCRNAFDGLNAINGVGVTRRGVSVEKNLEYKDILPAEKIPKPSNYDVKEVRNFNFEDVENFLNKEVLFRSRWEFRRGKQSAEEYQKQRKDVIEPTYANISKLFLDKGCFCPVASYGYYECFSENESLHIVKNDVRVQTFNFPRKEGRCLTDFFSPDSDVLGVMLVTLGQPVVGVLKELYSKNNYKDYYLLYGFAAETTEALAAYIHDKMREDLDIKGGGRFSFGYPMCPDLGDNAKLLKLVNDIGIVLTENYQMTPEFSTGALITH